MSPGGRPRKPPEERVRGSRTPTFSVEPGRVGPVPPHPDDFTAETIARWEAFWKSDVAQVVDATTDMPAVLRLFRAYQRHDHLTAEVTKRPFVQGSKGQPVVTPAAKLLDTTTREIERMEDRFGLTPKSRLQLGIEDKSTGPSIDDLNRAVAQRLAAEAEEEDPRAAI